MVGGEFVFYKLVEDLKGNGLYVIVNEAVIYMLGCIFLRVVPMIRRASIFCGKRIYVDYRFYHFSQSGSARLLFKAHFETAPVCHA